MRGVDDPHTAAVRRREVEPVAETVAVELPEQRQVRRGRDDRGADERRAVTDDEHIQVRCELRQTGLGRGVSRSRAVAAGVDREGPEGELRDGLEPREIV